MLKQLSFSLLLCCIMILLSSLTTFATPFQPVDDPLSALRDPDPNVRMNAAAVLGIMREKDAVKPLISALKDPDSRVRTNAAGALGKIGDRTAVPALIKAIKDTEPSVRINSISSLSMLKDGRAVKPIVGALSDHDTDVRRNAAGVLRGLLNPQEQVGFLDGPRPPLEPKGLKYTGKLDPKIEKSLVKALTDKDAEVRFNAARAIENFSDPGIIDALMEALKRSDVAVVGGAHRFFIARGIPESEPLLIKALEFRNTAGLAGDMLGSGNPRLEEAAREWERSPKATQHPIFPGKNAPKWGQDSAK
ncbi:MAG: HEAT repeat domain-containing protein [Armatimonadota bacterium]